MRGGWDDGAGLGGFWGIGGYGQNGRVIDEGLLRQMTAEERRELARVLARIELPHPMMDPKLARRRRLGLVVLTGCSLFLVAWIVILAQNLPMHYTATHWRAAWVGLDIAELAGFAATAWAAWHQRQVAIFLMIFTGMLLVCDAWFDVVLDYGTPDARTSVLSALLAELPLALLLFAGARRLTRITVGSVMRLEGITGPVPALWRIPLFADGLEEALPARFRRVGEGRTPSQPRGLSRLEWHG